MPLPPALPVATWRLYRGEHPAHAHGFAQVLFGRQGRLELEVDGRAARVDEGSGLWVPAGAWHAYAAGRPARVWVVDAPDVAGAAKPRRFALPPGWSPPADVFDALDWAAGAPRRRAERPLDPQRLALAVDAALHEDWTVARMAAHYALSAPRFHARWRALTGAGPVAWLRARRLDRAATLLRAGRTLDAAALQTGYGTASALATALRREKGAGARSLRGGDAPASR